MEIKSVEPEGVCVFLNRDDLMILNNSMNEARECLEDWEFYNTSTNSDHLLS